MELGIPQVPPSVPRSRIPSRLSQRNGSIVGISIANAVQKVGTGFTVVLVKEAPATWPLSLRKVAKASGTGAQRAQILDPVALVP